MARSIAFTQRTVRATLVVVPAPIPAGLARAEIDVQWLVADPFANQAGVVDRSAAITSRSA